MIYQLPGDSLPRNPITQHLLIVVVKDDDDDDDDDDTDDKS